MRPAGKAAPERLRAGRRLDALGFTLIELMVAVAIGVTLMVVAAPSMVQYRRTSELSDAVSSFVLASNTAKSMAMKSGRNTYVAATNPTIGWSSGWFVYADTNWNGSYDSGTDDLVLERAPLSNDIASSAANTTTLGKGYLMFDPSGFPRGPQGGNPNGTLAMTITNPSRTTNIIVSTAGRIRTCDATKNPNC